MIEENCIKENINSFSFPRLSGTIDEKNAFNLAKKKLESFSMKKFEAELKDIGYFSESFIRVLWVGVNGKELDSLIGVVQGLFGDEEREFEKHITFARLKKVFDKIKFKEFFKGLKMKNIRFLVDKIVLKSSVLTPEGPIYEDVYIKNLE